MDYPISDPGSQLLNGKFTDGDPAQGTASSLDKAGHMNAVYDELIAVISGLGLTPDEGNAAQLIQAINIAAPKSQITFHYVDLLDPNPVPGWLLCNGAAGTPDMRDRFIVCTGPTYDVGDIGGAQSASTSNAGAHTPAVTINGHTLTEAELAAHNHDLVGRLLTGTGDSEGASGRYDQNGTDTTHISSAGGNQSHAHTASVAAVPGHAHTFDNRPPFYALAPFIRADYVAEILANGGL